MIWSGHTESTFLFTLSFMRSLREDFGIKQAYDVFALVPTGFYMIGVVAARIHYTVDVLIALFLTTMIYRMTYQRKRLIRTIIYRVACIPEMREIDLANTTDNDDHHHAVV